MTHRAVYALAASLLLVPAAAPAQTIYRWHDAAGGVHFSNQAERVPANAESIELTPLGSISGPRRARRATPPSVRRLPARPSPCGPADPTGLVDAVAAGAARRSGDEGLTLLAGGVPISASEDATVQLLLTSWDPDAPQAPLSQSAIAYPKGSSCPTSPPLVRYSTNGGDARSRGLCDDYRRAFAQVGVAASRDAGIGRSFREVAENFLRVAAEDDTAIASGLRAELAEGMFTSDAAELAPHLTVPLAPWIVSAHVAQTARLADESTAFVEELTVALEEIDRAARASGCWE
jgi:hypothetical protein